MDFASSGGYGTHIGQTALLDPADSGGETAVELWEGIES